MKISSERLDIVINNICKHWNVPGAAISVLNANDNLYRNFYKNSNIENDTPVTKDTVFAIGSVTKSFTAALAAILQDKGILELDKPIKSYIDSFEMYDLNATKSITLADFLNQNSGLPSHNLYWHGSYKTRQELFSGIKNLQNKWNFGRHWAYNNINYLAAAAVMEIATGKTWEELVSEYIFAPLNLGSATFGKAGILSSGQSATGYKPAEGGAHRPVPPLDVTASGPAGCLNMSNDDLNTWAKLHLNSGMNGDNAVISSGGVKQILRPRCTDANMIPLELKEAPYNLYGLGWVISPYRGVNLVYDGGNIEGFTSIVALLPSDGLAVTIQTNLHEANLFLLDVLYSIIDELFFENDKRNWSSALVNIYTEFAKQMGAAAKQQAEMFESAKDTANKTSLPFEQYAGTYKSAAYGEITITFDGAKLALVHGNNPAILKEDQTGVFELSHYKGDTFSTRFASLGSAFNAIVKFSVENGHVTGVSVPFEPLVDDIDFVKV